MEAEKYLATKERLSLAVNGENELKTIVTDITKVLSAHNLDLQPETAFDVMVFTLETLHLERFKVSEYVQ